MFRLVARQEIARRFLGPQAEEEEEGEDDSESDSDSDDD